jgi:hypothetical protein
MRMKLPLALAMLSVAVSATAHHSFAMFNMKKEITVKGTVTEFRWTNPHSWTHVDVAAANGSTDNWVFEMTSPNNLVHAGWRRSSLKPGDQVTVIYHPLVNGKSGGALVKVTLPDGTVLENR